MLGLMKMTTLFKMTLFKMTLFQMNYLLEVAADRDILAEEELGIVGLEVALEMMAGVDLVVDKLVELLEFQA